MPPRKKRDATPNDERAMDYRYTGEKRTNIPPARIAGEGTVPTVPKARYAYSPHLPPTLQFDSTGEPDKLDALVDKATKGALTAAEATRLREALRVKEPTLEWAGKRELREKGFLEVDPVALHIHERVSARAIIRSALREDVQRDLFADPQQPYKEAVQFYKHDVDWANRLILGDSLSVMSSLAWRENLAGKVQMIYMDPPYGIKFSSNFQNEIGKRDVKEKEQDLTREPEMVKAYRDTWTLGVHSYLEYLRARMQLSRELLSSTGSIFVQISDENLHRVRAVMDEIYGAENFVSLITFKKTGGQSSTAIASIADYLLWYSKDRSQLKYRPLYSTKTPGDEGATNYSWVEDSLGQRRPLSSTELQDISAVKGSIFQAYPMFSDGPSARDRPFSWRGEQYSPSVNSHWKTNADGLLRLAQSDRLLAQGKTLRYVNYLRDYSVTPLVNVWTDTQISGYGEPRAYVVQTLPRVIQRCVLMTTEPGDLVLDPTCGSGTTALVAEQWGRRWITMDTSRVAISIARQRLLTARFDHYRTMRLSVGLHSDFDSSDPSSGFVYRTVPHVTLKSVAQNSALDPIVEAYQPRIGDALSRIALELSVLPESVRLTCEEKLREKERRQGRRSITQADRLRWLLPKRPISEWEVPFDTDTAWPESLAKAVMAFRSLMREKTATIEAAIASNAEQEELVDQPEIVAGVVRVSGPFTVEGVRPEELNVDQTGLFDGTPHDVLAAEEPEDTTVQRQNVHSYLERMTQLIRQDGLTFISNQRREFRVVERLFDSGTGTMLHAEGAWSGAESPDVLDVAVGFGPQYGPVSALQVEGLIRSTKRHKELVIAGFSFDADATAMIREHSHPKLRIHQAYIRPDVNPGMDGLLKDTPNSQLFTVFGTPEIEISETKDGEHVVELKGVDIYDPVANTVRSTGADKVAAWFLDSDFDGRCFCVTQAFFPDQDAWEKIAKALGSAADAAAFEAFKGTTSVPFTAGSHKCIAVKVIDPRGNEVMVVRALEA